MWPMMAVVSDWPAYVELLTADEEADADGELEAVLPALLRLMAAGARLTNAEHDKADRRPRTAPRRRSRRAAAV